MSPVLVLQFMADDGPGHLGTWLQGSGLAREVRRADQGPGFPAHIDGFAGLALLGGAMSVNDDLPYLRAAERLIEQALRADVPVIGHCLGGQLMARVLGAQVGTSPQPEVGWHELTCVQSPACERWFGDSSGHWVFHWHYEAFGLPAGCELLAASPHCPHQAFALGKHLAMQFHVEADAPKIDTWLRQPDPLYDAEQRAHATVHDRQRIRHDTLRLLADQQRLADRVYTSWAAGLLP